MTRRFSYLPAGAILLAALLAACHISTINPSPESDRLLALTGSQWLLTEIAGQKIKNNEAHPAYLYFDTDNRVSGSGGCNRVAGEYRLASRQLHFSRMITTRMACLDMRAEDALLAALPTVASYVLSGGGDVLTLYNGDGVPLAVFRRDAGGDKR